MEVDVEVEDEWKFEVEELEEVEIMGKLKMTLSEQMVETLPRVSTTASCLTIAFLLAILCTPMAIVTVVT